MNIHIYCHLTWADLAILTASTGRAKPDRPWEPASLFDNCFFRKTYSSLCLNLCTRDHSVPWIKPRAVRESVAFQLLLLALALQILIENIKKKVKPWICATSFSSLCCSWWERDRRNSELPVWVLLCFHLVHSTFVFFSSLLCLQPEESFGWERFPDLCCEAVTPQGRCRFLWGSSLWISRDTKTPLNGISSARTLLADLLQGIPKEKKGGKTHKPSQEKTPGSDSAVGISSHPCSVVSFCLVFFCFVLFL